MSHGHAERSRLAARIAELVESAGLSVAVAESLTGGMVASALAEAPGASEWFRGAVVAYASEVKHQLLTVPPGPVVSAEAAAAMVEGVRQLLGADIAVALTGAGGPRGQDGQPPGTVFLGLSNGLHIQVEHHHFDDDDPAEVCARTVAEALRLLLEHLSRPPADLPPEQRRPESGCSEASTKVTKQSTKQSQRGSSDMAEEARTAQYEVLIEGRAHPWDKDTISVADIRELGNLPANIAVVEEDLRDGTERTLAEEEVLRPGKLEEGKRPTKRVNFRQA
jgi:nicotinamide-nucleotide amidase